MNSSNELYVIKRREKEFNGIPCHVLPYDYKLIASINVLDKVLPEYPFDGRIFT
jgi:hypothetical protein